MKLQESLMDQGKERDRLLQVVQQWEDEAVVNQQAIIQLTEELR